MILKIIYYVLFNITLIYGLYFGISGLVGIFSNNKLKFKNSKYKSFFAIIVPARNEGRVIGNLIDSLNNLNYPKDKYKVYVACNNCTDNTSVIAKENGADVIECHGVIKTKGDVLKYVFNELKDDKCIDAYVVFDADNVVHKDFLVYMNNCLNSGYNVAEGFRDAKNPTDSWISGSYEIFYLFQNVFFNRARMVFNSSSSINGTGFMISKKIIDRDGFVTYTLTEDVEFTGQCALRGEKIAFVEDAVTYDEYPNYFKLSWKQRRRWSAGIIECMKRYSFKLFKHFIKTGSPASLDMSLVYLGPIMQVISFITLVMLIIFRILKIELNDVFSYFFALGIWFFLALLIFGILLEVFVLRYKNKEVKGKLSGILLFSLFLVSWLPINILCFLKKYNKWEQINHDRNIKISDIE